MWLIFNGLCFLGAVEGDGNLNAQMCFTDTEKVWKGLVEYGRCVIFVA